MPRHGSNLALLTDLYQLTMAYGYWKNGLAEREAVFHLYFRRAPFNSGYTVCAGLGDALDYLQNLRFEPDDLAYLATLNGRDDLPLFSGEFLDWLGQIDWRLDVDAMPEGTLAFPQQPLVRVRGPILQCQIVETALLNTINFQSLIATKAARVCHSARGESVLEFGLRRAQGIDGALAASRAAHIGGCAATSNVLAGKLFGIPVRGTHAHSWVMSFATEAESFAAYAAAMPNNCVFLVDTYDTLEGVREAIRAGHALRERGHELAGIRLDSGDLAWLSIEARKLLDAAGFPSAAIVASNDLDEHLIESLKHQGAKINVWGVGTKLVTAHDQPALGGVYKLGALRQADGQWHFPIKLSEQAVKISTPGILNVRRFQLNGEFIGDALFDETLGCPARPHIIDNLEPHRHKAIPAAATGEDLLIPVLRQGRPVNPNAVSEPISIPRARAAAQLALFPAASQRLPNPHLYPAGLEHTLYNRKFQMIEELTAKNAENAKTKG